MDDRMELGSRCTYVRHVGTNVMALVHCVVTGTWSFVGDHRVLSPGQDPLTDGAAHGYLLEPTVGGTAPFALFGDLAIGVLKRRPQGHTVGKHGETRHLFVVG